MVPVETYDERGGVKLLRLDLKGKVVAEFNLPSKAFPGLTDICEPGTGPGPRLRVLAIRDGKADLRSVSRFGRDVPGTFEPWRSYVVDLRSGDVALAACADAPDK